MCVCVFAGFTQYRTILCVDPLFWNYICPICAADENILVTNLRDALLSERDVQNILTLIKQKYGIDVGGGNKVVFFTIVLYQFYQNLLFIRPVLVL